MQNGVIAPSDPGFHQHSAAVAGRHGTMQDCVVAMDCDPVTGRPMSPNRVQHTTHKKATMNEMFSSETAPLSWNVGASRDGATNVVVDQPAAASHQFRNISSTSSISHGGTIIAQQPADAPAGVLRQRSYQPLSGASHPRHSPLAATSSLPLVATIQQMETFVRPPPDFANDAQSSDDQSTSDIVVNEQPSSLAIEPYLATPYTDPHHRQPPVHSEPDITHIGSVTECHQFDSSLTNTRTDRQHHASSAPSSDDWTSSSSRRHHHSPVPAASMFHRYDTQNQ